MKNNFNHFFIATLLLGGVVGSVKGQTAPTLSELQELVTKAEMNLQANKSLYGYSYEGSLQDYLRRPGLVNNALGNCNNANGYYQPAWMFNGDVNNTQTNYYTERQDARVPAAMKGQRHWVTFDFPEAVDDIVLKYTCVINVDQVAYGEAPTKIALVAAKPGEKDVWTDTLYKGKSIPAWPTVYNPGEVKKNSTFVGRYKLAHPVKQLRFVGLERLADPKTSAAPNGPFWGLAEMRVYDGKKWDAVSDEYAKLPQDIRENLDKSLSAAKEAVAESRADVAAVYAQLETAHKAFVKAFDDVLKPGMTKLTNDMFKLMAQTKYPLQGVFYNYADMSSYSQLQYYMGKADSEISYGNLQLDTYNYINEAHKALSHIVDPATAYGFWSQYDWNGYAKGVKTPQMAECLDVLKNMSAFESKQWLEIVNKFNANFKIGHPSPADGAFFRIKGAVSSVSNNFYMTSSNGAGNRTQFKNFGAEQPDASTIFLNYQGHLMGYANGHYLRYEPKGNNALFKAVPVDNDEFNQGNNKAAMSMVNFVFTPSATEAPSYVIRTEKRGTNILVLTRYGDNTCGLNGNTVDRNANWYLEAVNELPVEVGAMKYATLYLPVSVAIPEGVKAYTGKRVDDTFLLTEITTGVIPALTGVVIVAEQGTYQFAIQKSEAPAIADNELQGQVETDYETSEIFSLQEGAEGIGLYPFMGKKNYEDGKANPDSRLVAGFKAYLPEPANAKALKFVFDGESTGIHQLQNDAQKSKIYYDLNGKRVYYPTHGVYITGEGKKVFLP